MHTYAYKKLRLKFTRDTSSNLFVLSIRKCKQLYISDTWNIGEKERETIRITLMHTDVSSVGKCCW